MDSVTFIITWGTSRVVSLSFGRRRAIVVLSLLTLLLGLPVGVVFFQNLRLAQDKRRFTGVKNECRMEQARLIRNLNDLLTLNKRVSITYNRQRSFSPWEEDLYGGRGGGTGMERDSAAVSYSGGEESAPEQGRWLIDAEWEQKVDWLRNDFQDLVHYLRLNKKRLDATPSISPVSGGWITSHFGYRTSPFTGRREFHRGLDIAQRPGTPVIAPADGKVTYAGFNNLWGYRVDISHGYGYNTFYGHLEKILVKPGQMVKRGQVIGYLGSTGRATGPHLHYQINVNGVAVNPDNYIFDWGSPRGGGG